MKLPVTGGSDFKVPTEGSYPGIVIGVIDLGLQPGSGQFPDPKHQLVVRFELPTEVVEYKRDGVDIKGPQVISRTFTASMSSKSNLYGFVSGFFGKKMTEAQAADFDVQKLLGRRALLSITNTEKAGKTYANVSGAMPLPKGLESKETQHNPSLYYEIGVSGPEVLETLPDWMQKKINGRLAKTEAAPSKLKDMAPDLDGPDDDIPF